MFAAASLKNALDDAVKRYEIKTGRKVVVSYAASSALAKQIEAGAPADIFFSADLDWMDELEKKNLIDVGSRHTLLGNTLVLIAPKDSTVSLPMEKNLPLLEALGPEGKLAMANVDSVPAGRYGKAALIYLGVWDEVAPRVAQADNVRAALSFVARGKRHSELSTEPTRRRSRRYASSVPSPRKAIRKFSTRLPCSHAQSRMRAIFFNSSCRPRPPRPSRRKAFRSNA